MTAQPAERGQVSRELVVDTALRLIEEHDISALTMRRLAAELGTAVTPLFLHVGNRDALVDLLVDRLLPAMRQGTLPGRPTPGPVSAPCPPWGPTPVGP